MPHCNECGAFVSSDFARVLGNNNDEVFGCQSCGAQSKPDMYWNPDLDHTSRGNNG